MFIACFGHILSGPGDGEHVPSVLGCRRCSDLRVRISQRSVLSKTTSLPEEGAAQHGGDHCLGQCEEEEAALQTLTQPRGEVSIIALFIDGLLTAGLHWVPVQVHTVDDPSHRRNQQGDGAGGQTYNQKLLVADFVKDDGDDSGRNERQTAPPGDSHVNHLCGFDKAEWDGVGQDHQAQHHLTHSKALGLPPLDCGLQSPLPLGQFGEVDILQHLHVQVPGDLHCHGLCFPTEMKLMFVFLSE